MQAKNWMLAATLGAVMTLGVAGTAGHAAPAASAAAPVVESHAAPPSAPAPVVHTTEVHTGTAQGTGNVSAGGAEAKGEAVDHGGGHGAVNPVSTNLNLGEFIVTILIFLGLLIVLRVAAWKPIQSALKSREEQIRNSIEAAKKAQENADRTTRELEAKMADVQRQGAAQLQQAKVDAQKTADTIRAQAESESAALKERTLREIEAAKQQALTEINNHAAELGTSIARKILQRQVTADDQQRLVDESLTEMAKKN